jgi:hypothetical protein
VQEDAISHHYLEAQTMSIDSFNAVGIAEGFIEAESEEQVIEAWQFLIDSGLAWQLQGFFGRTASQLIEQGVCSAPA